MRIRTIVFAAVFLFSCAREEMEIGGSPAADLSAEQLVARAVQRYETASRYSDGGKVRVRIAEHEFVRGFTTRFADPSEFELVLLDGEEPRYTIRLQSGGTYAVSTRSGTDTSRDRDTALFGGTGVTSGISTMVPPLLLGGTVESPLLRMRDGAVRGSETVNGERCTRIEGTDHRGNPLTLWIGDETQVVRRSVRLLRDGVPQPVENQLDYERVSLE